MSTQTPAAWHPDPSGRHQLRYWDGARWTEHVSDDGVTSVDAVQAAPSPPAVPAPDERVQRRVQRQVERAGADALPPDPAGGHLLTEPVLVVNQKTKLIELTNEYSVLDRGGNPLGTVREVGQSGLKKAARLLTSYDQFFTHTLEVRDAGGAHLLTLTRPRKIMKSRLIVQDARGGEIGQIVQNNVFGKIRFAYEVGGEGVGSLNAENWRAWNFSIRDAGDQEVARITKTFEGLARTLFTTADHYVLQIHRPLEDPLRSLVVASALCVDTALKQDSRGLG